MTVVTESGETQFLGAVDEVLTTFFARGRAGTAGLPATVGHLWDALASSASGGKRVRPRLLLSVVDGYAGPRRDAHDEAAWSADDPAVVTAAALELLHTALVTHDDVIDHDFVRRGKPNVAGIYRHRATDEGFDAVAATERGQAAAIIAGDVALAAAYRLVASTRARELPVLLDLMDAAVHAAAAGELLDVEYSGHLRIPAAEVVLQTALLKTAIYSFDVPLQAGAVLAGAPEADRELLCRIGQDVGTAYQLVDDLLGVFGVESATGKTTTGDLTAIKHTLLLSHASRQAGWSEVAPLLLGAGARSDVDALRGFLDRSGSRAYVEAMAREHAERARHAVIGSALPAALRADLEVLIDAAIDRVR
ncbi:geranylgeranyl pyrophosphate synthase [Tersicoccus solisilvae]|uniref:Geranylgeranyl pyrophosphate synthase n=1 Tax=Tersicoccus solisilvae TaxID=1882339 RepID=A0ABQ1NQM7_9MICC|nr:polyprenyl synthetase family protein [Tersicoccus solisilvae]GGC77644.1 geranylgeranyl pyrophosphate synthase [Tersicoccus solisilvae]